MRRPKTALAMQGKGRVGNSSEGLPGWPRQADLLRRLAPIMSVRDETFTVRSLGEVMTAEGNARAWCEAVYQRVPEYVDPRIEPWKAPMGDSIPQTGVYPGELPTRPFPYMANALFGRVHRSNPLFCRSYPSP